MKIIVISPTCQELDGRRFYCRKWKGSVKYTDFKEQSLHRLVWETINGRCVPKGYVVHHVDHNPHNNEPNNLELMEDQAHRVHHNQSRQSVTNEMRKKAADWHQSEAGRSWHKHKYEERFKETLHVKKELICSHCGVAYTGTDTGRNRFCSNRCNSLARYHSGIDNIEGTCEVCGKAFMYNRYQIKRTCSRICGSKLAALTKRRAG